MKILRATSILVFASAVLTADAVDAYSNFDPAPNLYSNSYGYIVGDGALHSSPLSLNLGVPFTATAGGTLDGFQVAMNQDEYSDFTVTPVAPYTLRLYADAGNMLGALLGTYSGTSTGLFFADTASALSSVAATGAPVTIAAGSTYWIVASSDGNLTWNHTNSGLTTVYGNGSYFHNADAAFSVQVTPTPEPASFAALGLGAFGLLRRKRA